MSAWRRLGTRAAEAAIRASGLVFAPGPALLVVPGDGRAGRIIVAMESAGFASPTWLDLAHPESLLDAARPVCVVCVEPSNADELEPVVAVTEELGWGCVVTGGGIERAENAAWTGRGVRFGLAGVTLGGEGVGLGPAGRWARLRIDRPDRELLEAIRSRDALQFARRRGLASVGR